MHLYLLSGLRFNRIHNLHRLLLSLPPPKLLKEEEGSSKVLRFDHTILFRLVLSLYIRDIWHYRTRSVSKDLAMDFICSFHTLSNIFLDLYLDNIQIARDMESYDIRNT